MNKNQIFFRDQKIFLRLESCEIASMPIAWFPRLAQATKEDLNHYEITPFGIHWPALDEDLSFEGFMRYQGKEEKVEK